MSCKVEESNDVLRSMVYIHKNSLLYNLRIAKSRDIKTICQNFYSGYFLKTGIWSPEEIFSKVLKSLVYQIKQEHVEFKKLKFKIQDMKKFTVVFTF
jgi:hypothetical protein